MILSILDEGILMPNYAKSVAATKKDILRVSWRLFEKFGYQKTTYRMIADELGISLGTITYHFGGKPWILHYHFEKYANDLRKYISATLTEGFNYYLYFCILTIRFFSGIISSENALRLFNQPEFVELHSVEWIGHFETDFRNITEDFHKDFSDEEIHIAALMGTGARLPIIKEFSDSAYLETDPCCSVDQCCQYLAYLPGALSRLDEATILRNIRRAFEFIDSHDFSNIVLGDS